MPEQDEEPHCTGVVFEHPTILDLRCDGLHVLSFTSPMASDTWTAVWGFVAGLVVTVVASYMTTPPLEESLKGLVYSRALAESAPVAWYRSPKLYAAVVIAAFVVLNWRFF